MKLCNLNNMNTYNTYMNKHFITLTSVSVQAGCQYFVAHLVPASKKKRKKYYFPAFFWKQMLNSSPNLNAFDNKKYEINTICRNDKTALMLEKKINMGGS